MSVVDEKNYRDSRFRELEEERKYERESTNNAIIEQMVKAINKQIGNNPILNAATNMGSKSYAKSHLPGGHKLTTEQLDQIKDVENINKVSNAAANHQSMMEITPLAKHIGELAGALGVINQLAGSKNQAKNQDEHSDNITKSVYALQNGSSFKSIAPALGAGTLRSMMGAAGTVTAGSWLYDMIYGGGTISNLTNNSLAASNPGFLLSHLAGGASGLGSLVGSGLGSGMKGIGSLMGADPDKIATMKGIAGGLFKGGSALSSLDPTTAAVLGTMTLMGTSIGAKKLMDNMIKNSPLAQKENRKRWNISHQFLKASDNPGAMQNFMQSNNTLKQMQVMNAVSPGETQMIAKLNEIAFYTATLHDIYESVANSGNNSRNSGVRALNHIDKDGPSRDMSGRELQNAFRNGKLSNGMLGFLRANEGLKSIADVFSIGTYYKALKGENTAPGQFKIREAIQGGDPDQYKKNFAMANGLTLSDVELLHADLVAKIGSADSSWEGKMLAANVYSAELLQLLAVKSVEQGSGKGLRGTLNRMKAEQEASIKRDMFIDGMIKPFMEQLAKTPVLSALVPLINAGTFISGGAIKGISGLSNIISNPIRSFRGAVSGTRNFFGDIRSRVIDGMRPDAIKNEANLRESLSANAMSVQDRAYHYLANDLHNDLQKIQWLLGSTETARVQDRYTGDLVTTEELKSRYRAKRARLREMTNEQEPDESYLDEAGTWLKKKIFRIKDKDFRRNAMDSYDHLGRLQDEFSIKGNAGRMDQDQNLRFRLSNPVNINATTGPLAGDKGTTLYSMLNFMSKSVKNMSGSNDPRRDAYYDLMDQYIPLLQEIRDCVCKDCECKDKPGKDQKLKELQSKLNFLQKNQNKTPDHTIGDYANATIESDQKEKFYKVFYDNMPYLSKLFKLIKKQGLAFSGVNSGANQDGPKDDSDSSFFGGWFGGNKGKVQGPKPPPGKAGGWAAKLAKGGMSLATALAKPGPMMIGAGIAAVASIGLDYFLNDGKYMKEMWNSLKESSFGQTLSGVWDAAAKFYTNFKDWLTSSISEAWTKLGDIGGQVIDGIKKGANYLTGGTSHQTQEMKYWSKETVDQKLNNAKTNIEKLNILNSNKQFIDPNMRTTIIEGILNDDKNDAQKKYGFSLSPSDVSAHMDDINKFNNNQKIQFYQDFGKYRSNKMNAGYNTPEEDAAYAKISKNLTDIFMKANEDKRNAETKEKDGKLIQEYLKQANEVQLQVSDQVSNLVTQNNKVQADLINGLGTQIQTLAQQQSNITQVLNVTAKVIQKPQVYELDKSVTSVIPGLK